jgi:uncharacterized protein
MKGGFAVPTREAIDDFLAQKHIAVVGVSRNPKQFASRVYENLLHRGYVAYPVNPKADTIQNAQCYPSVREVPEPLDGVMVSLKAEAAKQVVRDCAERGVKRVWLHRGAGPGADSEEAVAFCRSREIDVIDGACALMFAEPVLGMHRFHRWFSGKRVAV